MSSGSRKNGYIALGSNLGDRLGFIERALAELSLRMKILEVSTIYESPPWGVKDQPPFLNCVAKIETDLSPRELLKVAKETELILGRKQRPRWREREIDIDILLLGDAVIETPDLTIPHRYLKERNFFLIPLIELDESIKDPLTGVPFKNFLKDLPRDLKPFANLLRNPHGT